MIFFSDDVLDAGTEAFHAALDRHLPGDMHGRDGNWVDGEVEAIVEALLMDGWRFPGPHDG
jgi:hypothetical protein